MCYERGHSSGSVEYYIKMQFTVSWLHLPSPPSLNWFDRSSSWPFPQSPMMSILIASHSLHFVQTDTCPFSHLQPLTYPSHLSSYTSRALGSWWIYWIDIQAHSQAFWFPWVFGFFEMMMAIRDYCIKRLLSLEVTLATESHSNFVKT